MIPKEFAAKLTTKEKLKVALQNGLHYIKFGSEGKRVKWRGLIELDPVELAQFKAQGRHLAEIIDGWIPKELGGGKILLLPKPNLVVNSGLQISLDRLFAIGGPPTQVRSMGVDDGASNPVAGTTNSTAGSTNRRIILFDSTPTRSSQTVTCLGTFTQATVAFIMKRLFLSKAAAGTTDAAGDLYAMTAVFTIDLTAFSTWSQTFTATVTNTGS